MNYFKEFGRGQKKFVPKKEGLLVKDSVTLVKHVYLNFFIVSQVHKDYFNNFGDILLNADQSEKEFVILEKK